MPQCVTEIDFQNRFMVVATSKLPCRLWRQQAGIIEPKRGGRMKLAPEGASDICGVHTQRGTMIQIECKLRGRKATEQQLGWLAKMREFNAFAMAVRFDPNKPSEPQIEFAVYILGEVFNGTLYEFVNCY